MKTRRKRKLIAYALGSLMAALPAMGETNLVITSFENGMLSWTNIDPNLYYSIEWRPSLTGTNDWSSSYRGCQDLQSSNPIITTPVPMFFRVLGSTDPANTSVISPTNPLVPAGYYEATDLTAVDADLVSANIRAGVTIFGVTGKTEVVDTSWVDAERTEILIEKTAWVQGALMEGTRQPSPVPKTGQTTSYRSHDDGDLQPGLAWPSPRFTVPNGEPDCVFDHLTGLLWLLEANSGGSRNCHDAIDYCAGLSAGLHDDWRLPSVRELQSLLDYSQAGPALPAGHPFANVQLSTYWTATTSGANTNSAWLVELNSGTVNTSIKTNLCSVWPVCGGDLGFRLREWYEDRDGDGYGNGASFPILATAQPYIGGYPHVANGLDPDDNDPTIP